MSEQTHRQPLQYIPEEILCAQDYEAIAHHFIEPAIHAYIAGGSAHDRTLKLNRQAFTKYLIQPRIAEAIKNPNTEVNFLKQTFPHPIMLAPVAYQGMVNNEAEIASRKAANATDSCMITSTLSSQTLESIAENSEQNLWFQLYKQPQDNLTDSLINRAFKAGYKAIVVTVDVALQTPSYNALRSGYRFPENLNAANLTYKPEQNFANVFNHFKAQALDKEMIAKLIRTSPLPIIIKGVMHPEDAKELKQMGVAGIVVSNHGGRTLDGVPASLDLLSNIRAALGPEFPILFDSGIRSGEDIFKAISLGADAVLIGRLQIYALSVAGALGVGHMLKLLREEFEYTMVMAGCQSIKDIKSSQLYKVE